MISTGPSAQAADLNRHRKYWLNRSKQMVCSGVPSHIFKVCSGSLGTLYGRKNSLLARRKLDRFPYLQYSTTTISGPGGADDLMVEAQHI